MKKVILIGSAHPYRGGLAAYNERLARQFILNNIDCSIYTFTLQYPNILFPGKTQYATWSAPKDIIIKQKVNSINPLNWIKVGYEIKKKSPDLLLFKYWLPFMAPCFGTISRIVKQNKHTKILSIIDNIIPHEKHIADKLLSQYFVNSADGFIAMSQNVLDDIVLFTKQKPRILCPHPLFDNFGEPLEKNKAIELLGYDKNYSYILFFGFIREYKGLDLLLHAFADERFRKIPVKLIIAGEFYTDRKPYIELINTLKLNEHIILKDDFIPDNEVSRYFSACDIVVQPYKSATQSGVTQIGYHFNKPMLVTNVGGLSEIIPNGKVGYVVNTNSKDIADALIDFYINHREQEYIPQILHEKQKYTWQRMIDTIRDLYTLV